MHKKNISFSIPLSGKVLKFSQNLINNLENKFSFRCVKNKKSRPHINLFSGSTLDSKKLISDMKKKLKSNYSPLINLYGFGAFISKSPTVFLRFENTKCLKFLRNIFFSNIDNWHNIDETVRDVMWIPKSTIITKDMRVDKMSEVMSYLILQKIPQTMEIKEISVLDFSGIETEVDNFKLS